jgi:hypothetical protein
MNEPIRRRVLHGSLLGVALALGLVAVCAVPKARTYKGKTVRQWVSLLDMHVDHQPQRDEASWALVQAGSAALPEVERILVWRPSVLETVRNFGVRLRIVKPRELSALELQSRACEAAYHLAERAGVDISRLVPHLQYHFTNGTYADSNSGRALARAGPAGISVLTNLLFAGGRSVRDNAGAALGHVNGKPQVIQALIRSAGSDPDSMLRANAVLYLSRSRGAAEQMVPLGLKFLKSDDGYERWAAASLLLEYRAVPEARAVLAEAISDPDQRVRSVSERALKEQAASEANRK